MKNILSFVHRTGASAALMIALPMVTLAQYRPVQRPSQPTPSSSNTRVPQPASQRTSSTPERTVNQSSHHDAPSTPQEPAHVSAPPPNRSQPAASSRPPAPSPVVEKSRPAPATPSRVSSPAAVNRPSAGTHPSAPRSFEAKRPDGSRVVSVGSSHGYVERPIAGRSGVVARTYVSGAYSYARVYRSYSFRGVVYQRYVPGFYFHPLFYSWVYNPWPGPVVFYWGYYSAPWYEYYGPYFAPAPVYGAPALWLTDFLIAENLKAAYEAQNQTGQVASPETGQVASITPEIKELISQQVRQELAAERNEAETDGSGDGNATANAVPSALDPAQRVFVVSMNLNVLSGSNQTCSLSPGDILLRSARPADEGKVGVTVLSSKAGNCPADSNTTIDTAVLEEMHNDFRRQIDSGLAVLARNQGKGGLPDGPAANPKNSRDGQAQVDLDAASAVMSQQQAASQNQ